MVGGKPAIPHLPHDNLTNYWMLNGKYFALIMS